MEENKNQIDVEQSTPYNAPHYPFSLEGHWQPWYDDRRDYNTNAPSYYDYLANNHGNEKAMVDLLNRVARRNIKTKNTNTVTTTKELDWISEGDNSNSYHDVITLKSDVVLSSYLKNVNFDSNDYNLTNSTQALSDGVYTPDYLPLIKASSTKLNTEISDRTNNDNILQTQINNQQKNISSLNTDVEAILTTNNIVPTVYEHLKLANLVDNGIYPHTTANVDMSTNEDYVAFRGFDVKGGVYYHIWNCCLYFSKFQDGTTHEIKMLTEDTNLLSSSMVFKPEHDGKLYITVTKRTFDSKQFSVSNGERRWDLYDENNEYVNNQGIITLIEEHKKLVKEMITSESIILNGIYGHHIRDVVVSTNDAYVATKPIRLYANRTYYIYNAQLYFSKVLYDDNTIALLSEEAGTRSATFTPKQNCSIFLTFTKQTYDSRKFGLSNGKRLWNLWNENNQYNDTGYDPQDYEITVAKDSTGDYTRLVDAVEAIPDGTYNQYTIYLSDGVYDMYQELGGDSWLSGISGNRNGLNLINKNVKIVGLGRPTIKLFIPDNLATDSTVPNVSVIECAGSVELNNLIVEGKNVRYVIHDESGNNSLYNNTTHVYKNVLVKHNGNKSGTWINSAAIACGMSSGCHYSFINSILTGSNYSALSLHNNVNQRGGTITIDGLKTTGTYQFDDVSTSIRFGYYMENNPTDIYQVVIKNLISDGDIYVRPESGSVPSTNIYNVTNFTSVNLNVK